MLLSANVPVPTEIYVHGFFTVEGQKMSKSLGNVIHPKTLVDDFGVDAVRYFLLREMPYASDGDVSMERIENRYAELANQLGNLVSRVATMSEKYFDGQLDQFDLKWDDHFEYLDSAMRSYDFKKYLDRVFELVGMANEIIDREKPFKLIKEDEVKTKQVLSEVAEIIRQVGNFLLPITPNSAEEILRRYSGTKILVGESLFPRRDQA